MSIPEDGIEAAAEAIYAARGYGGISKTDTGETRTVWAESLAYAEAAMPAIREAIAQEIEAEVWTDDEGQTTAWRSGKNAGLTDAARIVRGGTP